MYMQTIGLIPLGYAAIGLISIGFVPDRFQTGRFCRCTVLIYIRYRYSMLWKYGMAGLVIIDNIGFVTSLSKGVVK
jgi:hypothetical protein